MAPWGAANKVCVSCCDLAVYTDNFFFFPLPINAGLVGSLSICLSREGRVKTRAVKGSGNLEGANKPQP